MPDEENGRDRLSRIESKIDVILERLNGVCRVVDDHETRLRGTEEWESTSRARWDSHTREHSIERGITAALGTIATAAVGVLAWFK